MNEPLVSISFWQLGLALAFILLAGASSLVYNLGLGKDLAVGTVRTFAQLFLMGYALTVIFRLENPALVLLVYCAMIFFAARIVRSRVDGGRVRFFLPTLASMMASYLVVTVFITSVVVGVTPWWKPQYFLPLGGMVVGNSMTAIALCLERLFSELRNRFDEVEMMLSLGADYREASASAFTEALRAGMIPSINSMMGVGVVFIPGMMTGQILAGANPVEAIRYQIVVMLMLVGSTALGSLLVLRWVRRRAFGEAHELLLSRDRNRAL